MVLRGLRESLFKTNRSSPPFQAQNSETADSDQNVLRERVNIESRVGNLQDNDFTSMRLPARLDDRNGLDDNLFNSSDDDDEDEDDDDYLFVAQDANGQDHIQGAGSGISIGSRYVSGIKNSIVSTFAFRKESTAWKSVSELEKKKEHEMFYLLSRYNESVDGGYLAPFHYLPVNKYDYSVHTVRSLIIGRKLAPFYVPLDEFQENWSREQLLSAVTRLPLHERMSSLPKDHPVLKELEETSNLPVEDLGRDTIMNHIDKSLPFKKQKKLRQKIFHARNIRLRIKLQEEETEIIAGIPKKGSKVESIKEKYYPNDDLKIDIYSNVEECPICFFNMPAPLNKTKCCKQNLCTECFILMKRQRPQLNRISRTLTTTDNTEIDIARGIFSYTELDNNEGSRYRITIKVNSTPAKCPYCTQEDFAVTYNPPSSRRTGIGGVPPATYDPNVKPFINSNRKSHIISELDRITCVKSDDIRPYWQLASKQTRVLYRTHLNQRDLLARLANHEDQNNHSVSQSMSGYESTGLRHVEDSAAHIFSNTIPIIAQESNMSRPN